MDIDFSGKSFLVTGGASGIGEAVVHYLAGHSGRVVIADINDEAGEALAATYPGEVVHQHCDVSEFDDLTQACAVAKEAFGALHGAVNSAGIGGFGNSLDLPLEEWQRIITINLSGVFFACRAELPLLIEAGGGSIVNIASLSGVRADYSFTAYNAAKAGVINYTRALALDHAAAGIRATAICPGFIDTPLVSMVNSIDALKQSWLKQIPMGRAGKAEDVANLAAFLLSPASSYITGTEIIIDGGMGSSNNQPNLPEILASL